MGVRAAEDGLARELRDRLGRDCLGLSPVLLAADGPVEPAPGHGIIAPLPDRVGEVLLGPCELLSFEVDEAELMMRLRIRRLQLEGRRQTGDRVVVSTLDAAYLAEHQT